MIRSVADRITSKTQPSYRGRHRRTRTKAPAAPSAPPAAQNADERAEGALAVPVGAPAAPPT